MLEKLFLPAALLSAMAAALQAHDHFAAGVIDRNGNQVGDQGEQLKLDNASPSGMVFPLHGRAMGELYGGYHVIEENLVGGFSFVSRGLLDPDRPADFANIVMEISNVAGPAGGQFGFWEAEGEDYETPRVVGPNFATPSAVFTANQPTGGFRFPLTIFIEGDPDPGGHIHNRAWTVDRPGTYTVAFTLYDISTEGAGGGPIQTPSQPYVFQFIAVPEPGAAALLGAGAFALLGWRKRRAP